MLRALLLAFALLFALLPSSGRAASTCCGGADSEASAGALSAAPALSAPAASCCGTDSCKCGAGGTPCGNPSLSDTKQPSCLCGCSPSQAAELPLPLPMSARAELTKALVRVEMTTLLLFFTGTDDAKAVPARSGSPAATPLYLLNLNLRT